MKWYHWLAGVLLLIVSTLLFFKPDLSRKLRAVSDKYRQIEDKQEQEKIEDKVAEVEAKAAEIDQASENAVEARQQHQEKIESIRDIKGLDAKVDAINKWMGKK